MKSRDGGLFGWPAHACALQCNAPLFSLQGKRHEHAEDTAVDKAVQIAPHTASSPAVLKPPYTSLPYYLTYYYCR